MSGVLENQRNINVIVPVYNVEEYLEKCIDSLLNQTYHDYYITLVDDCSTDGSGSICDLYKNRYPSKVKVLHKDANQGLSEARNSGVFSSESPWIVFVDSDDYVSKDFLQNLYNAQNKYQCDMVVAPICKEYIDQNGTRTRQEDPCFNPIVFDRDKALIELCYEKRFGSYAVSKLIKKKMLLNHTFPKGKLFEDSYTIYKLFFECETIVCIQNPGYYYLQRTGSIQRSPFSKKHYDLIYACDSMMNFFSSKCLSYDIMAAGYYKLIKSCNVTCIHAIDSGNIDETYSLCEEYINKYRKYRLKICKMSAKEYVCYSALMASKRVYLAFFRINKMLKKNKL